MTLPNFSLLLSLIPFLLISPPVYANCPFAPCLRINSAPAHFPLPDNNRNLLFLPQPPARSPALSRQISPSSISVCSLQFEGPSERKVLQLNGTADDFLHFTLCPADAPVDGLQLLDFSTDQDVLTVTDHGASDVQLDRTFSEVSQCQNVTATFTFDRMVGKVTYNISVQDSASNALICSAEIAFIVVGFSVFEERQSSALENPTRTADEESQKTKVILSGEGNEVISDYRDNLVQRLKQFKVKIQFPDGTDSTTRPHQYVASALNDMNTVADTDATSPVKFEEKRCDIVNPPGDLETSDCGAAIETANDPSGGTDVSLELKYESYKDGLVTFLFEWDSLTRGDPNLGGEQFVNVLYVNVMGDPAPIIEEMQPRGTLRRVGGEQVRFVLDNTEGSNLRVLRVGDVTFEELEGSYRRRSDGLYDARYSTQPGNETDLEWRLYVSFPEGKTRAAVITGIGILGRVSYVTTPLTISSIQPSVGKPGDTVSLDGYFDGFDPGNRDHNVVFGQKTLRALDVTPEVNDEGTVLSFEVPGREAVGASYDYQIHVTINNETSTPITFSYIPDGLKIDINVYGASYNKDQDQHELGGCAISRFVASLPSGVSEPESFAWSLIDFADPAGKNLILNDSTIGATAKSLLLLPRIFQGKVGKFEVTVSCVVNGENLTSFVTVRKFLSPIIGVTLSQPQPRSVSLPDVPVRVSAIVIPPRSECYNLSSKIIYKWSYLDVTQEFSYRNFSSSPVNESSMPARLGREYVIPQSSLAIGDLTVSLIAFMEDDPSVSGSARTSLLIHPAPLVPVIGYGASKILHSTASDLIITAKKSYNPDAKYLGDSSKIDVVLWDCKISSFAFNASNAQNCDERLLPDRHAISFSVTKISLGHVKEKMSFEGESVAFSIQYSLRVGIGSSLSLQKSQIVEISSDDFEVAKLDDLRVLDNRGEDVDWLKIQSFGDILIVPDGTYVSWSFRVVSPSTSSLMFKEPGNLIIHPGYFDPTSPALSQVLPLGVKGGTLGRAQEYEISVSISSKKPGMERGEARVLLRTQDKPMLLLPDLPIVFGDSETMFTAYAQVNLDATHEFLYFFYLVGGDGDEYCLDGCSGWPFVQFRLTEAGKYRILVRLMDIQGKALLDEAHFSRNVSMSGATFEVSALSSGTNIGDFEAMLRNIHYQGDHGTFELLASSLASRARKDGVYASTEEDTKVLDLAVDAMHQIVQNSAPTTMASKSYVKTACRFAAMDAEFFASQETMYTIFSMVHKAITHVPMSEAFDLEEELLSFYNLSAKHVINALASSSARVRLQQFGSASGLDTKSLLVDLYRLQEEHLTTILSRDAQCGMVRHLTTLVPDGVAPFEINNFVINKQTMRSRRVDEPSYFDTLNSYDNLVQQPSYSSFTLAVLCNPDQAKGIRGEATSFRWCDEVFTESGVTAKGGTYKLDPHQKRLFTIMETLDYVWLSGLGGDDARTDSNFLVTTNVTALGNDGLSLLALPEIPGCYSVNTSMVRLGVTSAKGCLSADGYMVQALAVVSTLSKDRSSTILVRSSRPGVFGVFGQDCPINARKPTLALPDGEDTKFVYVIFGGVCAAMGLVMGTWIVTSFAHAKYLESAA